MSTLQSPIANNSVNDQAPSPADRPPVKEAKPAEAEKKPEKPDPTPLFWRMFGASAMSIAASLAIVLYFQVTQSLNAIRADVTVLREGYIQLVPKSEFSKGHSQVSAEVRALKEKNEAVMEIWTNRVSGQERNIDRYRSEYKEQIEGLQREIQQLRERLAVIESRSATVRPKN